MSPILKKHFDFELSMASLCIQESNPAKAWDHLSRAHILGQFHVVAHLQVHWRMLVLGLKTQNVREIWGQVPRLILAAPGSFFKKAPLGNTGRSDVGIFQPMSIPEDLQNLLNPK